MGTCADAVKEAVTNLVIASTKDVINFIYRKYPEKPWKEISIRTHMTGCSINHSSSKHYPYFQKFLFYLGNGKYRIYDPENDGKWIVDSRGVHLADDSSEEPETEEDLIEASISLERDLEEHILRDLTKIEDGLKLYKDNGLSGQQLSIDIGRIDILALDRNNNFVVIELKSGKANYHVIGQILSYISWVKKNLANGRGVRGVIIANDFDEKVKFAVSELPDVKLKKYDIKFEFENV